MGKQGLTLTIADRLRKLECGVETLDIAVRELHPDHTSRIVERITELEEKCRNHANSVFRVLTNQRQGVEAVATKASTMAIEACARLDQASERHETQAAMLRQEVGLIKDMVDENSLQCERDLNNMKAMVQDSLEHLDRQETLSRQADAHIEKLIKWDAIAEDVRESLQKLKFEVGKQKLGGRGGSPAETRGRVGSVPALIRHAQKLAESRSPSSRNESCKQKRIEFARTASQPREFSRERPRTPL